MLKYPVAVAVVFSPVVFASSAMAQTSDVASEPAAAPSANAPPPEPRLQPEPIDAEEERPFILSLRGSLGLGGGSLGIGARFGLAGEYWLTDAFAVGVTLAGLGQTSAGILGGGTDSSASVIAPVVGLRGDSTGGYLFGTLGAGYAFVTRTELSGLCLDFGGGCPPNRSTSYSGYGVTAAVGWLGHPGRSGFEIGPVLRFDAVEDFRHEQPVDSLITLNVELGFAARASR